MRNFHTKISRSTCRHYTVLSYTCIVYRRRNPGWGREEEGAGPHNILGRGPFVLQASIVKILISKHLPGLIMSKMCLNNCQIYSTRFTVRSFIEKLMIVALMVQKGRGHNIFTHTSHTIVYSAPPPPPPPPPPFNIFLHLCSIIPYVIPEHQELNCSPYQKEGKVHSIAQTHFASEQHNLYPKL